MPRLNTERKNPGFPPGRKRLIIEGLAAKGYAQWQIVRETGFDDSYVQRIVGGLAAMTRDGTTPKFAHHDRHVAQVMSHGGFVALSERTLPGGLTAVCLPLIWPARAA